MCILLFLYYDVLLFWNKYKIETWTYHHPDRKENMLFVLKISYMSYEFQNSSVMQMHTYFYLLSNLRVISMPITCTKYLTAMFNMLALQWTLSCVDCDAACVLCLPTAPRHILPHFRVAVNIDTLVCSSNIAMIRKTIHLWKHKKKISLINN